MFRSILRQLATECSDTDAAELIFGELVNNALRHGGHDVRVEVYHEDNEFRLEVWDRGEGFDPDALGRSSDLQEGGRGLLIVKALTHGLHVTRINGGCRVSTRMNLRCRAAAA